MTDVIVHVDINGAPVRAGMAYFTVGRGSVSTTFVYDSDFLSNPAGVDLEPELPRRSGQQYIGHLPGSFQDCSPDRWGRNLIIKRRRAEQRAVGAYRLPTLTNVDILVGVSDVTRQGDLRFTHVNSDEFLDPGRSVPKLISLPELVNSADADRQGTVTTWTRSRHCSTRDAGLAGRGAAQGVGPGR